VLPGLRVVERRTLRFEPSLVLGRNGGMEASGDVPTDGATERVALADAFRRATATAAGRVVESLSKPHARESSLEGLAEHVAEHGSPGRDRVSHRHDLAANVGTLFEPLLRVVGRHEEVQHRAAATE
jgi:hypothetical protein